MKKKREINGHGDTNGHGGGGVAKLMKQMAFHVERVNAYQIVLADLNGLATTAKQATHRDVIGDAIALDEARRSSSKRGRPKKTSGPVREPGGSTDQRLESRRTSARLLAAVESAAGPISAADIVAATGAKAMAIGPLVRRGYLKKTKRGYARTAKAYTVEPGAEA